MATFWRPKTKKCLDTAIDAYRKQLGTGVYLLWARCDLCSWSGPFSSFWSFHKGPDECQLCEPCYRQYGIRDAMLEQGWLVNM